MDPFEFFQTLKPQIESDTEIIEKLRRYALTLDRTGLEYLGSGIDHTHYRVGKVGDLWLAIRDNTNTLFEEIQLYEAEYYINRAVELYRQGKRVSRIVGGVKIEKSEEISYFLLVEDLTQGGTANFRPASRGLDYGYLNRKPVYYDIDNDFFKFCVRISSQQLSYMRDDKVIVLRA